MSGARMWASVLRLRARQASWWTRSTQRFRPNDHLRNQAENRGESEGPYWGPGGRNLFFRSAVRAAIVATLAVAIPAPIDAKIAVFIDGRVLKVDDAYLDGDTIVLLLRGGGRMEVSAVRIERVVADEVEEPMFEPPIQFGDCPVAWTETSLPDELPFRVEIQSAARNSNLDPRLLASLVWAESAFDPVAVSRAGAKGLTQLMPAAAADHRVTDVFDPEENLRGGADHLRFLLDRFKELPLALAAYNAGATTVERYGGIPPYRETRSYVRRILEAFCPVDD
jgi:hypothetical protein